jgi:hypothetical protein
MLRLIVYHYSWSVRGRYGRHGEKMGVVVRLTLRRAGGSRGSMVGVDVDFSGVSLAVPKIDFASEH